MATLQDVAAKAGVSRVTVSKVINNYETVSKTTREKVLTAIKELDMDFAELKRNKESSMTIGMLMPLESEENRNRFCLDILTGAESKAFEKDYLIVIGNSGSSREREAKMVSRMLQNKVDGMLLLSTSGEQHGHHLEFLIKSEIPVVLIDQKLKDFPAHVVRGDHFTGAIILMDHLMALGHERIAFLTMNPIHSTYSDRIKGYQMSFMKSSLTVPDHFISILSHRDESFSATIRLLQFEPRPTALFVSQPTLLVGVLKAVQSLNLRIPEDISIVAFDNKYASIPEEYHDFFTSINQSASLIGSMALELLWQHLTGPSIEYQEIILPGALNARKSTGPAPAI